MARKKTVNLTDTIESWRIKSNNLSNYVGEPDNLTTTIKTDLVQAVNEIQAKVGDDITRSKFSLIKNGSGTYITPAYDSNSGVFSFQVDLITAGDVSNLDAGDITTGTFNTQRIPGLAGTKITSGTINAAYLPSVGSLSGTISASQLASVTSDNLTEGSTNLFFDSARVATALQGDSSINIDPATGKFTLTISETQANAIRFGNVGDSGDSSGVLSFTPGTGVTISNNQISIGQDVGTSSAVTFGNISGNVIYSTILTSTNGANIGGSLVGDVIATQAEAEAGVANDQVMTPLRVKNAIDNIASSGVHTTPSDGSGQSSVITGGTANRFRSSEFDVDNQSGVLTFISHNLGGYPDIVNVFLELKVGQSDGGYSAGDQIKIDTSPGAAMHTGMGYAIYLPSNSLIAVRLGTSGPGFYNHKSSNAFFVIDKTKWTMIVKAIRIT